MAPIFIVGCPRSGTSLLRNLLRAHPRITFPGESHFIPRFFRAYGDPATDAEARRLAARILGLFWIRRWNLPLTPDDLADCRTFREMLFRLYGAYAAGEHKPRWGDKTPQYVAGLSTIARIFPEAKFIHLIRDGRDVAISWLKRRMEPQNIYMAARLWRYYVEAGRTSAARLPPDAYLEVRYEALLHGTRHAMETICTFVGEAFDERVLQPDPLPPAAAEREWWAGTLLSQPLVPTNTGKWTTEMSERDRVLFESVAGDLLESLGYGVNGPIRRVPAAERLVWRAHHGLANLIAQPRRRHFLRRLTTAFRITVAGWRAR